MCFFDLAARGQAPYKNAMERTFVPAILSLGLLVAAAPADPSVPCWQTQRKPGVISREDYPLKAMRHYWQGDVDVAYTIGVDGHPKDCSVTRSSGHDVLDEATCSIVVRRFCYRPKTDGNGVPSESPSTFHFRWRLP